MSDSPRALVAMGLLGGYSLSAWLRFDRDAPLIAIAVLIGSLALMAYGASVRARLLREARRARARRAKDSSVTIPDWSDAELTRAFAAWNESAQAAGLEETIRKGPLVNATRLLPMLYFWVCTLVLLFVPARVLPQGASSVPRFMIALALSASSAFALALLLGFFGWRSAKARGTVRTAEEVLR